MLDEECLRPGVVSDSTFLAKLNQLFSKHSHYESKVTQNAQRQYDHTSMAQLLSASATMRARM